MRQTLQIIVIAGLVLSWLATSCLAAGLRDVIRTLETPFQAGTPVEKRISDYSADFFQEARIASLDRMQRASGQVAVRFDYRDNGQVPRVMFYWEYQQPTTQEIVSDSKTLWVYLPENNQVIQSDIEASSLSRENDPMTFLTGLGNLSRDFTITWAEPNQDVGGNYILDLRPRRASPLISRLVIVVDRMAVDAFQQDQQGGDPLTTPGYAARPFGSGVEGIWFPILSTTVYDPNGNSTIIEFSNLRVNMGIPISRFRFIMPAGVEVVRPSGQGMGF